MQIPTTRDDYIAARDRLSRRLRNAIKRGDYATAAVLRESIATLTREIDGR